MPAQLPIKYLCKRGVKLIMTQEGGAINPEVPQAFLDALQNDLKNLSLETKKKYPQIKEVGLLFCYVTTSNNHFLVV